MTVERTILLEQDMTHPERERERERECALSSCRFCCIWSEECRLVRSLQTQKEDEIFSLHRNPCRCFRAMVNVVHFVFGVLGNVFGLALFLAPVVTFYKVIRKGSTEEFSGVPYVSALFNCLLYTWYGLPFVSPHNLLVSVSNGAGAVFEFIYVCLYLAYAPPKYRMKILGLFVSVLIMFGVIAVVSIVALHHAVRKLVVGLIAAALSVCMYAAPLSIMRVVIQTKSVEFMPFFLSLFVFLCGSSWLVYGVLGRDAFVAIPNGLGALFGAAQLVLYCVYKGSSPLKTEKPKTDPEEPPVQRG